MVRNKIDWDDSVCLSINTLNTVSEDKRYVGFVYCIEEIDTGMLYYGIKKFRNRVKYPPLKGRKNKRIKYRQSDWRTYNTSSTIMQKKLTENRKNYHKEIIKICTSVIEMKAVEAYHQLKHYMDGTWDRLYNECINLRLRIRK